MPDIVLISIAENLSVTGLLNRPVAGKFLFGNLVDAVGKHVVERGRDRDYAAHVVHQCDFTLLLVTNGVPAPAAP